MLGRRGDHARKSPAPPPRARWPAWFALAAIVLVAIALRAAPARSDISAELEPATQTVAPGAEFDLTLQVTSAPSTFNAFDAHISFDAAAVSPVPLSPLSLQIGALMSDACSNLFHDFRPGLSEDTVGVSLLCSGVSVSGAGALYHLRFLASNTPQATVIHVRTLRFFDAGVRVLPVTFADAQVGIGAQAGVGGPPAAGARLELRAWPQPASGVVRLQLSAAGELTRLRIYDLDGRMVRDLSGAARAGQGVASWDTRDEAGLPVPPGLYFASAEAMGRTLGRRLVIAR
jgi:hypothetical protein